MDTVFSWANTASVERQGEKIPLAQIQPGDFFVTAGNPGHAVLVLDIAKNDSGKVEVLLGQSYMPAQNFHVLRPRRDTAWFAIDPASDGLQTPFWPKPFPWSSLRRLTR
jgi:thiamine monophosphate kinase